MSGEVQRSVTRKTTKLPRAAVGWRGSPCPGRGCSMVARVQQSRALCRLARLWGAWNVQRQPARLGHRFLRLRRPQSADAAAGGGFRRGRHTLLLHPRTNPPALGGPAGGTRQRAGAPSGHFHALLLLLGGAAVHRLCHAGVPLGVTFSFLIAAPMVNEVARVLLCGLFGWRVAALYLATGLVVAMLAGWVIGRCAWSAGWKAGCTPRPRILPLPDRSG